MHKFQIKGISASPGIAKGPAFIFKSDQFIITKYKISAKEVPLEIDIFKNSIKKAKSDLTGLQAQLAKKLSEEDVNIFSAHLFALEDPMLESRTCNLISKEKKNAAWALQEVIHTIFKSMSEIDDDYLSERAIDIVDIGKRILAHIGLEKKNDNKKILSKPVIIVAKTLTPSETVQFDKSKILGLISETGSATSHVAILARALQVPAIVGTENILAYVNDGDMLIIDAMKGKVLVKPSKKEIELFHKQAKEYKDLNRELLKIQRLSTITKSGTKISIKVNLEIEDEINILNKYNHDGIGLCRTEFLYMDREHFPDEEEQYRTYTKIVKSLKAKPITIRTLDIGSDKIDPNFDTNLMNEINPSLGCRGIRLSLRFPNIFLTQIKSILRASVHGQVRIMFPMISGLSDFIQAKNYVNQAKDELNTAGHQYDREIKIGVMIEVPSAAIIIDILARHVDFVSIGTNDLTQYVLASDRLNPEIANLYSPYHPAMVRILNQIIKAANELNCPISICGELASDEKFIPLLIGMGIKDLSVSPQFVPKVKGIIRNLADESCRNFLAKLLTLETSEQIEQSMRSQ